MENANLAATLYFTGAIAVGAMAVNNYSDQHLNAIYPKPYGEYVAVSDEKLTHKLNRFVGGTIEALIAAYCLTKGIKTASRKD